jgi:hypothetical protein
VTTLFLRCAQGHRPSDWGPGDYGEAKLERVLYQALEELYPQPAD